MAAIEVICRVRCAAELSVTAESTKPARDRGRKEKVLGVLQADELEMHICFPARAPKMANRPPGCRASEARRRAAREYTPPCALKPAGHASGSLLVPCTFQGRRWAGGPHPRPCAARAQHPPRAWLPLGRRQPWDGREPRGHPACQQLQWGHPCTCQRAERKFVDPQSATRVDDTAPGPPPPRRCPRCRLTHSQGAANACRRARPRRGADACPGLRPSMFRGRIGRCRRGPGAQATVLRPRARPRRRAKAQCVEQACVFSAGAQVRAWGAWARAAPVRA